MICEGIHQVAPSKKITICTNELQTVEDVIKNAVENSITVFFADNIKAVVDHIRRFMTPALAKREKAVA